MDKEKSKAFEDVMYLKKKLSDSICYEIKYGMIEDPKMILWAVKSVIADLEHFMANPVEQV